VLSVVECCVNVKVKVKVTLRLAVYRQSVRLASSPLRPRPEFFFSIFVVDKAAMGQVFSEYFGFPCKTFHQFLHHHNHPGLAQ
jgi:hypothetical protein